MGISMTIYKSICFVCIKEMSQGDVSVTHTKHMFDREKLIMIILGVRYSYIYLPIV